MQNQRESPGVEGKNLQAVTKDGAVVAVFDFQIKAHKPRQ